MFCFKCGKQIRDDSVFCQFCGAAQNNGNTQNITSKTSASGELDRNALKIYLGNILSLECIKANYRRRRDDISYRIYNIKQGNYRKHYVIRKEVHKTYSSNHYVDFWFNGKDYYIAYTSPSYPLTNHDFHADSSWKLVNVKTLSQTWPWEYTVDTFAGFFAKISQKEESRDGFLKAYAEFSSEAPGAYQKNVNRINSMQQQINGIDKELKSVEKLLKQAYDVNIIPDSFRNKLHAIYYLHNFISTSQESLTTALLHCDLDEIKKKLDKIIAQQETIIIQQAVMTAQNQELLQQNQLQLQHLASIESNTSQAAQYAQIAANNAETCAWISVANYIEAHR